jgi:hydroxycarboxylate dehydrogenase B
MELDPSAIRGLSIRLFVSAGASQAHAEIVADHLVEASLMGLHSHGLIRLPEYLERIAATAIGGSPPAGFIDPAASPVIERREGSVAVLDGRNGFGQVVGRAAAELAIELAGEAGSAVVSARRMAHLGRLGAYVEPIARAGLVGLGFCSAPRSAHLVAPFGGLDGRLSTNPIAYALPSTGGPVVADFATSAAAEGVIRYRRNTGQRLPEGVLRNAAGEPTTDPNDLYTEPGGTIQPFGGEVSGHKGSALGILVEAMGTLMAGEDVLGDGRLGNDLTLIAIRPPLGFPELMDGFSGYVRSSRPVDPAAPVMMPGDRELARMRAARRVTIDAQTWRQIAVIATARGVPLPPADEP